MYAKKLPLVFILCWLLVSNVYAFDLLVNGFGTVCGSKSDLPKYQYFTAPVYPYLPSLLGAITISNTPATTLVEYSPEYVGAPGRWNFLQNSKFGLQFTSIFTDQFKAVVQLVGRGQTLDGNNFDVKMDWAYLQYNYSNDLFFQFGRFRVPAFYYSDYLDVNNAQPWVQPPEEVYYIVGGAFRNMNGIKLQYAHYFDALTFNTKFWYGNMNESVSILSQDIDIGVEDAIGGLMQIEHNLFSVQGSIMRAIYNTNLNGALSSLVSITQQKAGTFAAAQNLNSILQDSDVSIVYVGLSLAVNITDRLSILAERASIMSPGIVSTARIGWYASLMYSLDKWEFTFTYGFTRPLETEVNKYNLVNAFFNSSQYVNNIEPLTNGAAGKAVAQLFKSYLGQQRSYGIDIRYDILPSLALKGQVKCINPTGKYGYIFNRVLTNHHVMVYRLSFDFVF